MGSFYWSQASKTPGLSEEFIREHAEKLDWYCVSKYQTLSEEFILEFADKVNWYWILREQGISEEFVLQHLSYFLEGEEVWRDLPEWCPEKGWNLERLTEAREMLRLLV